MNASDNCKDGASKTSDDGVCELEEKLQNMSTAADNNNVLVCANCGKAGSSDNMNVCNKCKQVKYCNAVCKKKHRHKHKKECEEHIRQAAERAAKSHDEKLFKQPPSEFGDCPICFLRLPTLETGRGYMSCCGKTICKGCIRAPVYDNQGNLVDIDKQNECPFCRALHPKSEEEARKRIKTRVDMKDARAMFNAGCYYYHGRNGFPQDMDKALELYHRAAELGYSTAYNSIGYAYSNGQGVKADKKKAVYYYELAAMAGDADARYNLGNVEVKAGSFDRALKHYMIAVECGDSRSLDFIKLLYSNGHATKEVYTKALQLYQTYLGEIKSSQRDKAAAFSEEYRYC